MNDFIIAEFDTQFAACAAVDKLLSRRLQREQMVLSFDESVGNSAASSSAPTTVVSKVSHRGLKGLLGLAERKSRSSNFRSPGKLTDPVRFGHATLALELHGELSTVEAQRLLEDAGGHSIVHGSQASAAENPDMWPKHSYAAGIDVERAICAAKGLRPADKTGRMVVSSFRHKPG